jgi:hypothetical protein
MILGILREYYVPTNANMLGSQASGAPSLKIVKNVHIDSERASGKVLVRGKLMCPSLGFQAEVSRLR